MSDAPQPVSQPQWKLTRLNKEGDTEVVFITSETTRIGRELDNEIPIDDLQVSRYHTKITLENDYLTVEDLGSANGTKVNDTSLTQPAIVQAGDTITVASYNFEVQGPPRSVARSRQKTEDSAPVVPVDPVVDAQPRPVESKRRVWPWLLLIAALLVALIIILAGVIAGQQLFFTVNAPPTSVSINATPTPLSVEIIVNQAPPGDSQVPVNQSVTIQATAFDPAGVTRVELWINGRMIEMVNSPLAQNAQSMTVTFQWAAEEADEYVVELRSYNQAGLSAVTDVTTLIAHSGTSTPEPTPVSMITPASPTTSPTPAPTSTPLPPTATATETATPAASALPTAAVAMLRVDTPLLNVRAGPSTQYELVGRLAAGDEAQILGQSGGTQAGWWQISFAGSPNGLGWVSASSTFVTATNTQNVPVIPAPPITGVTAVPPTATATGTSTPRPTSTTTSTPTPQVTVVRPPDGKTLLVVSNRSLGNYPVRLTLSGGKSVGGGKEIDPPPGGEVQFVLEPDFYRAVWSASYNNFARGSDFTAVPGKVIVMWAVPEEGRTEVEIYDELIISDAPPPTPQSSSSNGPPPGKALFVVANRSLANEYALLTITGGNFGGGKEVILNANTESQLELIPGDYRTVWTTPAGRGMNAGKEFAVKAGETIYGRIIPENGEAYMQFPGQPEIQINN